MNQHYEPYIRAIDEQLQAVVPLPDGPAAPLYTMMAYHLGWRDRHFRPLASSAGKRVRPLLSLLCCQASGGNWRAALPAAAALELIHNFSLIHDDIEDSSPTRRGRPTVWSLWGVPHGVNVGDAMLMLARCAIHDLSPSIPRSTVLQIAYSLDQTCLQLCEGQYLDLQGEGNLQATETWYESMIEGKTAALMATSARIGALVAGAHDLAAHYEAFGKHLGLAFQLVDDLLGIWGDQDKVGKPTCSDLASRKMTLPVIFALQHAHDCRTLARIYARPALHETDVATLLAILDDSGARDYVQRRADQHEQLALESLERAQPNGEAAELLHRLAEQLIQRDF